MLCCVSSVMAGGGGQPCLSCVAADGNLRETAASGMNLPAHAGVCCAVLRFCWFQACFGGGGSAMLKLRCIRWGPGGSCSSWHQLFNTCRCESTCCDVCVLCIWGRVVSHCAGAAASGINLSAHAGAHVDAMLVSDGCEHVGGG
jgi:hypothetical protein